MSEYSFASALSSAPLTPPSHSNYQAGSSIHKATKNVSKYTERSGYLSSFLCHVLYLEKKLRDEEGQGGFIDSNIDRVISRAKLGEGGQFNVYSAQAIFKRPLRHLKAHEPEQVIAVKMVKPMVDEDGNRLCDSGWGSILLEVRALMHEHLRYHPNIVRLLGFSWAPDWNSSSGTVYPMLIMEYARFGSLQTLQHLSLPLSFAVKQKLCHDVARGLSILHACGIIHGDLNHKNVLVFENPYNEPPGQPYLAKLADFGGAVMDTKYVSLQGLKVGTFPYEAPESLEEFSADGLKKMDIYSFGLLVWQVLLDGLDLLDEFGFGSDASAAAVPLQNLKQDDKEMRKCVLDSIGDKLLPGTSIKTLELIAFVIRHTLRTAPAERNLAAVQAALRNGHTRGIPEHLIEMDDRNTSEIFELQDGIQRQSFNVDKIGFQLGKMGDFYDPQQNLPGYRIELPHPAAGRFLFEPMKIKSHFSWGQQVKIVEELKEAALAENKVSLLGIPPFKAAFYVFQSYLAEFGVTFDANEACYWLNLAAKPDDEWQEDLFAQAWLWRICDALQCPQPVTKYISIQYVRNSLVYGFTECAKDFRAIVETMTDDSEKQRQSSSLKKYQNLLQTYAGGVGMRHYFPNSIRRKFDLSDLGVLDQQIREELEDHYERYLLTTDQSKYEEEDKVENRFNKIYVSTAGHGLLHFAATFGKIDILKHILKTYKCDINRGSAFKHDSPLLCAVRSAQYDCIVFLLQQGAQPGKISLGEEGPLHCLCGFEEEREQELRIVVKLLIDTGADIEELSGIAGGRGIAADWDSLLDISTTPLGRAVIARNKTAIKILLDLGADPRGKGKPHNESAMSPMEIAGMLFYPEILQILCEHLGKALDENLNIGLFDEAWVLNAAHERGKESVDPSCLQSRLVRLGSRYKSAILGTFRLIRNWRDAGASCPHEDPDSTTVVVDLLYKEVLRGDTDVVEALLEVKHDPDGTKEFRPLQAAVSTRNWRMVKLLLDFGADVHQRYQFFPDIELTFLHALGYPTQGSRTPDGVKIARQLLAAGVPVEMPLEQCSITPFAVCVMSRCFDVADVLLAHGATLNPVYARPPNHGPPISLLGGLVMSINEAALDAINYIIKRSSQDHSLKLPDLSAEEVAEVSESGSTLALQMQTMRLSPEKLSSIAVPSCKMNVLHQVAFWTQDIVAKTWPVSTEIMELLLTTFADADTVNEWCPEFGTPLSIAAFHLNVDFVCMLLEKKADPSIDVGLSLDLSTFAKSLELQRKFVRGTPLCMSLMTYESIIVNLSAPKNISRVHFRNAKRLFSTLEMVVQLLLPLDQDEGTL